MKLIRLRDQELRFSVHESVDYQKLKVSVFNEDKKTDLIGECWVELENVLRRGGGRKDSWHDLNSKGRYAGQIRIELTYYDTRPREQSQPAELSECQENEDGQQSHLPRTNGPRQPPLKRRPLPSTAASSSPTADNHSHDGMLQQETTIQSHQDPSSREDPRYYEPAMQNSEPAVHNFAQDPLDIYQRPELPGHSFSESDAGNVQGLNYAMNGSNEQQQPYASHRELNQNQMYDQDMVYADDPQALEAVDGTDDYNTHQYQEHAPAPLQPSRRSYTQPPRPTFPGAPPHTYSAPELAPHEQVAHHQGRALASPHRHGYTDLRGHVQTQSTSETLNSSPPPPPTHRNSMPTISRTSPQKQSPMQVSSGPRRALHHATNSHDVIPQRTLPSQERESLYNYEETAAPYQRQLNERRQSDDANYSMSWYQDQNHQQHHSPVPRMDQALPGGSPTPANLRAQPNASYQQARPKPTADAGSYSYFSPHSPATVSTSSVPVVRPRPISPNTLGSVSASPPARKPVGSSSNTTPISEPTRRQEEAPSMPFSPDSFAQFNPHAQHASPAKSNPFDNNGQIQPMYNSDTPGQGAPPAKTKSEEPRTDSFGRIVRSDGRRVDPSDYLPSSTFAAEPEPKGADKERRANIKVNVKSRFGPREAAPIRSQPTVSPNEAPNTTPPHSDQPPPQTRTPPSHVMSRPQQVPRSQPSLPSLRQTPPSQGGPQTYIPSSQPSPHSTRPSPASTPGSIPISSPLQNIEKAGRNRLQKRYPQSSPLAPSQPNALNQNYRSQMAASVPPPVPHKIPLDAPSPTYDSYDANTHDQNAPYDEYAPQPLPSAPPAIPAQQPRRHTAGGGYQVQPGTSPTLALSHEISQIDIGPSPSQAIAAAESHPRYGGLSGGRMRRSRFGA